MNISQRNKYYIIYTSSIILSVVIKKSKISNPENQHLSHKEKTYVAITIRLLAVHFPLKVIKEISKIIIIRIIKNTEKQVVKHQQSTFISLF